MTNLKFFNFFEFFPKDVLKTLLRGAKTNRKKIQYFSRYFRKTWFFWPQKVVRPSVNINLLSCQGESENQVYKEKETQGDPTTQILKDLFRGIKLLSRKGESVNQGYKEKETQGDPTSQILRDLLRGIKTLETYKKIRSIKN